MKGEKDICEADVFFFKMCKHIRETIILTVVMIDTTIAK